MAEKKVVKKTEKAEKSYTKEQLRASQKYREKADVLMIALNDKKKYTFSQVDGIVREYLKIEVK